MSMIHHSESAEKAVIGCLISSPARACEIISDEKIIPEHFWFSANRDLFEIAFSLGESCDHIQVFEALKKIGKHSNEMCEFVIECMDSAFIGNLKAHCEILKDKFNRRKIVDAAFDAQQDCEKDLEPIEIASKMAAVAVEVSDAGQTIDKDQIVQDSLVLFENARNGIVSGVPLPWDDFSKKIGGIQRRCVCPLLGRDGAGKSFLVSKILTFLGQSGIPALSIPFEDGADRQMRRMAGCVGQYSTSEVERGYYRDQNGSYHRIDDLRYEQLTELAEKSLNKVAQMPVYFEDSSMTAEQIRVVAGKHKRKHNIQILFVDGVKDVVPSKGENATKQEEHISRVLVQTAKELDIAIVPVSHLTDIPEDVMIQRRNMRGAKSQFHNARQVLIYQNAGFESKVDVVTDDMIALHMEKNNYGRESMMFLEKDFDRCDFKEIGRVKR